MSGKNRKSPQKKIEELIEKGWGQGEGLTYHPWLEIQGVPSKGVRTREKGWKTGRVHHVMSRIELMYLYLLEWSRIVFDIREQYPLLPQERTLEIAEELGIEHPKDPYSHENIVMTTDFMLTINRGTGRELCARTVKPVVNLGKRELEKFRIEQRYYQEQGIDWELVTDQVIPFTLSRNIDSLHDNYYLEKHRGLDQKTLDIVAPRILKVYRDSNLTLANEALKLDKDFGFEVGTCLFITKHLLARKIWLTDMGKEINYNQRIQLELGQQSYSSVG